MLTKLKRAPLGAKIAAAVVLAGVIVVLSLHG